MSRKLIVLAGASWIMAAALLHIETWCAFDFPAEEATVLREALTGVTPGELSSKRVRRPGVSWWPQALQGSLNPKEVERAGLEVYKTGFILVAIDWQRGRAFFYRERA